MKENEVLSNIEDIDFEGVEIILKKQKYILDYSMAGMKYLAKKYGTINQALMKVQDIKSDFSVVEIDFITDLIYAGLVTNHDITVEEIEKKISMRNLKEVFEAITKALVGGMPQSSENTQEVESGN